MPSTAAPPERLRRSRDVLATLRHGSALSGRLLGLHARRRDDDGRPRVAVIASKKVSRHAVDRNRARRLLREAARAATWPAATDAVLVARPPIVGTTLAPVETELRALLARLATRAARAERTL